MNKMFLKPKQVIMVLLIGYMIFMAGCISARPEQTYIAENPKISAEKKPVKSDLMDIKKEKLTLRDALRVGLNNNRSLQAEKLEIPLARSSLIDRLAQFDPEVALGISGSTARSGESYSRDYNGNLSLEKQFSDGTDIDIGVTARQNRMDTGSRRYRTGIELGLNRPLLRDAGVEVNTLNISLARLDIDLSRYQLQGFVENLAADIEKTYWDYVLATRQLGIHEESLKLARRQLSETEERIKTGRLAPVEEYAARAEVARQQENLIDSRSRMETTLLQLMRIINIPGWREGRKMQAGDTPVHTDFEPREINYYIDTAFEQRPELKEARLRIDRNDLQLLETKNGLLPRLDFFLTLGRSNYAESFSNSLDDLNDNNYDLEGGLKFTFPYGNREREEIHRRAKINRRQVEISYENLKDAVNLDIQTVYQEVKRAAAQIEATRATKTQREEALRAEREKFRVGRSTSFQVAQAQRNLTDSRISEVQALTTHRKALVDLYRLSGLLLEKWQIGLKM
jgi:outer membrane protein TolC